ncbi:MAG: hypothetical protein JJE45_05955 [Prolixibacteraceae bacterium]|nr:hypothetical protein [Prolixibacteraceae bacterium]
MKYFWCLGEISIPPPHCPLDRIIQEKGLKAQNIVNWTAMDDMNEYLRVMHHIEKDAKENSQSIAEWELEMYEMNSLQ